VFLGHFAVALAAKKAAPAASLGTLIAAAQFADLLWPILVLAGAEQVAIAPGNTAVTPLDFLHYPYSHSLVALIAWGIAWGIVYALARKGGSRAVLVIAALVVSHWFLDVLAHRPDMPLTLSESTKLGLGLWDSIPATMAVELVAFGAGAAMYLRATRARDRIGRYALAGLVAFLLVVYLANVFGPPPPSVNAVAWTCVSMWLLVAWGAWIDRHREAA
jgi:hypothetical protein